MLIDGHCHIFTRRIVESVGSKPSMVDELKLGAQDSIPRLPPEALQSSAEANGIDMCLLLPSASPDKTREVNDRFIAWTLQFDRIRSLCTLHPAMKDPVGEAARMFDLGIRGIKMSSFSQRFSPLSKETERMLCGLERLGRARGVKPALVLDTFARADIHFGASVDHLTTPHILGELTRRNPGLNFVGAHMGGLLADFDDVRRHLIPAANLYLDTANAAHTLEVSQFIELLRMHGADHILFGTDWPWFVHEREIPKIEGLLRQASYDQKERDAVFGTNAQRLFGL